MTMPRTPTGWRSMPPECGAPSPRPSCRRRSGRAGLHGRRDGGLVGGASQGRNFESGKRTFAAARCVVCHRFGGEGGSTGPDLTQAAGRFTLRDLAESLVEPNKVISDQYRATVIGTNDGRSYVGRIIGSRPDSITLLVDPEVATKWINIATADIEKREPSPVSLMPANLLTPLNQNEMLDLMAYLLSRGNPQDPMFSPK